VMGDDWRVGFKRAVIDVLLRTSSKVRDGDTIYGWTDYREDEDVHRLISTVGVDYGATTWEESTWDEFMGTFYEGDTRVRGVDIRLVLLDKSEHNMRWTGSVAELITQVVNEAGK
jgi:hypothetical protein